ncbi:Cell morphogenesis protein PAG1, partial [Pichia californica]
MSNMEGIPEAGQLDINNRFTIEIPEISNNTMQKPTIPVSSQLSNEPMTPIQASSTPIAFDLDLIAQQSQYNDASNVSNPIDLNQINQTNITPVQNYSFDQDDSRGQLNMNFKLGGDNPNLTILESPIAYNPQRFSNNFSPETSFAIQNQKNHAPTYTLNIVVRQFTKLAERKLNLCLNSSPLDQEPNIVEILSEGVDPMFDRIISSLGYIAKRTPKRVTDAVMHWRRGKSELREMARTILERDMTAFQNLSKQSSSKTRSVSHNYHKKSLSRSRISTDEHPKSPLSNKMSNLKSLKELEEQVQRSEVTFTQADRQFTISTFILWRVLIEVIKQTPSSTLMEDTGLEEIMYNYLRSIDPYLVSRSLIHSANWNLLSELIGHMSEKSFLSVSDRFIADLEKFPTGYTSGKQFSEASLNLLIHGMRYLQFSNSSLDRFEEGADFIKSLAKFFYKCENENIFLSYCDIINQLLLSLAGTLTAEVNHPTWVDAIKVIYSKSLSIANSSLAKYWGSAITLAVTALSVAPKEMFEEKWKGMVDIITKRLKPKATPSEKVIVITCVTRLTWAYLYRYSDTLNSKTRTMEQLANLLFLNIPKKQQWLTEDALLIQTAVQFFRALAYSQLNFTLENIFIPFLKSSFNNFNFEVTSYEKMILCIRSYCCILWDHENHERPPFPTDDVIQNSFDPLEFSNIGVGNVFENESSNSQVHEEISSIFLKAIFMLESQCGCKTLEFTSGIGSTPSTPSSATSSSSFHQRISNLTYFHTTEDTSYKNSELFTTVITSISWCANSTNSAQYRKIIELLVKNCIHENETTSQFCIDALKILICKKNPSLITTTFATIAFCLDEKVSNLFDHEYLASDNYVRLLEVYLEVLQSWLESLTETEEQDTEEKANAMYNVNHGFVQEEIHETKKFESLELKSMATLIDDVEGNGLFFFFSHDFRVRYLGCQVLRMVTQFDEAIYNLSTDGLETKKGHSRLPSKFAAETGTRIIEVLGSLSFVDFAKNKKTLFSEAELKRYNKFVHNEKKNSIIRLAESSHGVDAALWFKIFEDILETLVKTCPIQIAIARSHSCIRLVQLYDQIVRINNDGCDGKDNAVIWDYMLYLKIACASLTSTNEQRLHIPDLKSNQASSTTSSIYSPLVKSHSRKRSQQLFTVQHQKITSAKSIFRMTVPLLTTSKSKLRDALVEGLSCINVNIFKTFIQSIDLSIDKWENPFKGGFSGDMTLKQEICCVLSKVILRFSKAHENYLDESILQKLTLLLSNMLNVLSTNQAQGNFRYQRLRKYFCNILETLQTDLLENGDAEKWFSFDFRNRSFEFMVEWTGYGQTSAIFSDRYSLMRKAISTENDTLNLQASLEMQKHQLQLNSISCISKLCGSPISDGDESFDFARTFGWLDSLFKTYNDKISGLARNALLDILIVNGNVCEIFELTVKKCYTHDAALGNYFITLKDALIKGVKFDYEVYLPLSLALFSSGSENYNVRSAAAELLEFTENKFYNTNNIANYVDGVCCRSRIIYKRTLFQLSTYFATSHPEEKYKMISELTLMFNLVGSGPRRDLVAVLLPWVQTVDLNLETESTDKDSCLVVLSNFFDITMRFSHKIQNELEALWVALGTDTTGEGVTTIYNYIITNSLALKNLSFIECSRQVIVSLSTIPCNFNLINSLISNMEPKAMIPFEPEVSNILISEIEKQSFSGLPYVAKLSKLIQKNSSTTIPAFSLCELSIIFLSDLILIPNDKIGENLPLLLHISLCLLDHQLFVVQDQAAALIIHLIHEYGDGNSEIGQQTVSSLRSSELSKNLWTYNDLTAVKNNGRVPDSMDTLVRNLLTIFESKIPTIQKDWSIMAIHWATTCKVMHVASRSFQVFRCLISFLDQTMLRDMLSCLTNTISDENTGIQGFSMQILMTLNAITSELYSEQLIAFPQLFWSSVASLTTIHENEFIEVLSALSKFISKIDFNSQDTVNCLSAIFPPKWEGKFEGLQKIIMIGLRSSNSYEPTLKLIGKLNQLENSQIIGEGKHRVLLTLLANMPRFLHAHTTKRFSEEIITAGNYLSDMADKNEIVGLSRIIDSLIKRKFRNKEDFMSQIVNVLKRHFFQQYAAETLVFLLGLLFNKISWIKIEIMDLLKHVFRVVDLSSDEFVGLGADLIAPLLRLLLTDYVDQALEVLDEAASISASPFDKHYLMMSAGDPTMRKDYDKIVTLFGIPDESGWSVPMPSIRTAITRNNIHSVYSTCVKSAQGSDDIREDVEDINENHVGENELASGFEKSLQISEPPYFSAESQYVQYNPLSPELQQQINRHHQQQEHYNADNVSVTDKDSLSNMLATLETLDSFFTKDGKEIPNNFSHKHSSSVDTRSTTTTNTTTNTIDKGSWNLDFDVASSKMDQAIQFESTASFRTLLADVSSPTNEKLLSPRYRSKKSSRRNSLQGAVEPLKLARDLSKESNLGSPLIIESNNEGDESDNLFGFDLLRQANKTRRRSARLTGSYSNSEAGGNLLLKNSPLSPRNPRSPRHSLGPYNKSKFRTYLEPELKYFVQQLIEDRTYIPCRNIKYPWPAIIPRLCILLRRIIKEYFKADDQFIDFFFFGVGTTSLKIEDLINKIEQRLSKKFPNFPPFTIYQFIITMMFLSDEDHDNCVDKKLIDENVKVEYNGLENYKSKVINLITNEQVEEDVFNIYHKMKSDEENT